MPHNEKQILSFKKRDSFLPISPSYYNISLSYWQYI